MTVAEIAEMLKVKQQTVRNSIYRGEPGVVRVRPQRVRVRQAGLHAFLAAASERQNPVADLDQLCDGDEGRLLRLGKR